MISLSAQKLVSLLIALAVVAFLLPQSASAAVCADDELAFDPRIDLAPQESEKDNDGDKDAEETADEDNKKAGQEPKGWIKRRMDRRVKRLTTRFEETDKVRTCVSPTRLRNSMALDDQRIMFIARGGDAWVNTLPLSCPNLLREDRFIYTLPSGPLCRAQIITIIDPFGRAWNSCTLGDFRLHKKKKRSEINKDEESGEKASE